VTTGIGNARNAIARSLFDPHRSGAGRDTEHDDDIGLLLPQQCRQLAVDRVVAGCEHMGEAPRSRECRPTTAHETGSHEAGRVDRRARKAAKAGNENGAQGL
jgi:hypothetical protein